MSNGSMLIKNFLAVYTAFVTRRYLKFKKQSPGLPPKPGKNNSYLLYMHIPFCEELCPYCAFVRVKFEPSLASRYFDALKREIELYHKAGYCFDSIYIGGGTPTIMPDRLAQIVEFAKSTWPIKQISVETNPNHLDPDTLGVLTDIGVNRLSVGVQSFNNEILGNIQRLKKYGSGEEIQQKLSSIAGTFDTINVDMIFNFPNQTEQMLAADIKAIKETNADQITWYPLIVSNSKKKEIAENCGTVSYKKEQLLYQMLVEQLADVYSRKSVWCFSNKKGAIDEYIIDHDEYVGAGLGAWSYVNEKMYSNTFSIPRYISMIQENKSSVVAYRNISFLERIRYYFMLKLLGGNLNLPDMIKKYGKRSWFYIGPVILFLFADRAITFQGNNITLTPKGRYYWVILMRTIFAVAGDYRETRSSLDANLSA